MPEYSTQRRYCCNQEKRTVSHIRNVEIRWSTSPAVVKQFPSYIKDTNHIINKVNNFSVPVNSILVTMDVRSLCPSIPHNEGIAATKKRYDTYIYKTIPSKIIKTFLALILTLNNFIFNSKFYLQIKGCVMGTICAPAYVNISWLNLNQNTFIRW